MAFNGSGTFSRLYNWAVDASGGVKIRADRMDSEMNGFATGLSTCITKDGQTTITANLPMSTYKHTNVGSASSRTDYARFDQLQDGKTNWVDSGGTADSLTATYSPAITTLVDGQLCYVRAGAANATTTPTFSPNGLTARVIVKNGGDALAAGDIAGDGHELILRYDLTNTRWELLNPSAPNVVVSGPIATVSSSATIVLNSTTTNYFNITGTTTITGITLDEGVEVTAKFAGVLTLTNGASLINISGANITTAAGDIAVFRGEAAGVVRMIDYVRASGQAVVTTVSIPIGAGMDYWGTTAPTGWIFPYGQEISRTTYSALFAVYGTTYGAGDGSTTFNVPDKRGRVSFSKDDMGGSSASRLTNNPSGGFDGSSLGNSGGAQGVTPTITTTAAHSHAQNANTSGGAGIARSGSNGAASQVSGSVSTDNTGNGNAFPTVPPGIVCNYIIYTGV